MKIIDFDESPLLRQHFDGTRGATVLSAADWMNNLWSYGEFASDDFGRLVDVVLHEVDAACQVAPAEHEALLPRLRHLLELECSACCEELLLRTRTPVTVLAKCGHAYHASCIAGWLARAAKKGAPLSCPYCRADLDSRAFPPGLVEEIKLYLDDPGLGDAIATSMISVHDVEACAELRRLVLRYNAESAAPGRGDRERRLAALRDAVEVCAEQSDRSFARALDTAAEVQNCRELCARVTAVCADHPERRSEPERFIAGVADFWSRHSLMTTLEHLRDGIAALDVNYRDVLGVCRLDGAYHAVWKLRAALEEWCGNRRRDDGSHTAALLDQVELLPGLVASALAEVDEKLVIVGNTEARARGEIARVREQLHSMMDGFAAPPGTSAGA
ncbi:RING finger domain-containing protein [Lentzea sp. E54]|uniref:RING finger domain-containing protein n=1 Tax=Lentzea xerophila TaxID=3435883 RepID=UPI003DA21AF2